MPLSPNIDPHNAHEPPVEVPDSNVLEKLAAACSDEIAKKKLRELLTGKEKPTKWSHKSRAPYYKERFALWIKSIFDSMIQDGKDRLFRYDKFPDTKPNTILNKISQAKCFLLKYMDPDGTYARFCDCISFPKEYGVGIWIKIHKDIANQEAMIPDVFEEKSYNWHDQVNDFMDNGPEGELFHLTGLGLSKDDLQQLYLEIGGLQNVILHATSSEIKLIKTKQ